MTTAKGRKRKLSCYRSKSKNPGPSVDTVKVFKPNYVRITHCNLDSDDEPLDVEHSSGEEFLHSQTLSSSSDEQPCEDNVACEHFQHPVYDACTKDPSFCMRCLQELKESDLLDQIVDTLHKTEQLHDFMCLLRDLKSGKLPCDNIVFLLLLERVKFQNCSNTVAMRYGARTKLFWSIVYRLCKGSGLKFFSGSKNWGQVVNKESDKSLYYPELSKINFAVPDEKVLHDYRQSLPKIIPPGKIYASLDLLKNKKDIILMGDGKLVTKGLKTDFVGDVNLFGHENNPNLEDLKHEYMNLLDYISSSCRAFKSSNSQDQANIIEDLLEINTKMCQRIREYHTVQRRKLSNFVNRNDNQPERAISTCKTNMYTSSIWIKKALKCNVQLMQHLATLRRNLHLFSTASNANVYELPNVRILYEAEYVSEHLNALEYPHLIKHYSELWYDLIQESVVTTETAFEGIGLGGIKSMKSHFKEFIKQEASNNSARPTSLSQMELNSLATVASTLLPALLPSCAVMYEEGCSFIHGQFRRNLLCATNAAIIRYLNEFLMKWFITLY